MTMKVIGAGVGRTGTMSLRLAINQLGLGPCHHMEDVLESMPTQVPLWTDSLNGNPNWSAIFSGFESAVDWPTAAFYRELVDHYPSAKFILTTRSPESWVASFGSTILKLIAAKNDAPPEQRDWLDMAESVITKSGFSSSLDSDGLMRAFVAHNESVISTIPAERLLVFEVKDGWDSLCDFLGKPVPDDSFPRSNNREEFWDLVEGNA